MITFWDGIFLYPFLALVVAGLYVAVGRLAPGIAGWIVGPTGDDDRGHLDQ
jgi:hypothetical protein